MKVFSLREFLLHLALVVLSLVLLNYPGFDLTIGVFQSADCSLLWPSTTGTLFNLGIFYIISFYLIPEVLRKRGSLVFIIQLVLVFAILTFLEVVVDLAFVEDARRDSDTLTEIVITVTMFNLIFVMLALAYRFAKDWFMHEKQRISIGEWKAKSELQALKNQINPHFLFNALNSLFSLSLKNGDEKTAEGIGKLAEMMRYVFDKSNLDKVSMEDEIQYIKDYIYMQKLRFEDSVAVVAEFSNACRDRRIAPMILIPFIENAFKYGVNAAGVNEITCRITCQNEAMEFYISNEVLENAETMPSTGIGLENVKKRLELIYPDQHTLEIDRSNGLFAVKLKIQL